MLETDIRKIDFWWKNIIKSHHINLDTELDCVILFSTKDEKFSELLYHKVVDSIIDRIHPKNVYKDFSNALENINAFISSWGTVDEKVKGLHGIIGIYHKKTFLFSSIGTASCYLYNSHKDLIEVTDKEDTPKNFSFISNGDIADNESLILSNIRLLDILSKDDIRDGLSLDNLKRSGDNIEHILLHEHDGKNLWIISLKKELESLHEKNEIFEKISYYFFKSIDNRVTKEALWYIYHMKDKLLHQTQKTRQILLSLGILVSIGLLYIVLSWFFQIASNSQGAELAKENLLQAQSSVIAASENMNNPDMFELNIENAQTIITDLEAKQLFLGDISILKDNMSVLQKQFNGIEPFEVTADNTMYSFNTPMDIVKVVNISNKIYVVHKNSITGPIVKWESSQNYEFKELVTNDYFIDASVYDTNIVIMTHLWKVVNFAKNNYFSYVDVSNQPTWEMSPIINSYASNLYLLSDSWTQILRHKSLGTIYDAWVSYLTDSDAWAVGKIVSIAIDGWIYILKQDGSVLKLFREPTYRLESIVLNKLPKNYNFQNIPKEFAPSIRARADIKNVYMLLENKILVFKPNTTRYQDVKSLEYIGQIEGKDTVIEDFYVDNDGEIFIGAQTGVYKVEFSIVDNKLILK